MSDLLTDARHLREQAKESRDRAAAVDDEIMREQMLAVADAYDRIAALHEMCAKFGGDAAPLRRVADL